MLGELLVKLRPASVLFKSEVPHSLVSKSFATVSDLLLLRVGLVAHSLFQFGVES